MNNNYYIVRCNKSGVFFGHIEKCKGREVTMTNVRKIWYWNGAAAVEQLACEGVKKPQDCKFTMYVEEIIVTDATEILRCTPEAVASIKGVPEWKM